MIFDQMLVDILVIMEVFVTKGAFNWWLGAHISSSGLTNKSLWLAVSLFTHYRRLLTTPEETMSSD